jgi:hypothetical protein
MINLADSGTDRQRYQPSARSSPLRPLPPAAQLSLLPCFVDLLVRNVRGSLLGQFGVVLEGLGFGQEGDGLGDLRVPLG